MPKRRTIVADLRLDTHFGRKAMLGIARHLNALPGYLLHPTQDYVPPASRSPGMSIDGVIIQGPPPARLLRWGIPIIRVTGLPGDQAGEAVLLDNHAIGRMGAEHLLSLGFRNFGWCGLANPAGLAREEGFRELIERAGHRLSAFHGQPQATSPHEFSRREAPLIHWLTDLPKPAAIMTYMDTTAYALMLICHQQEISVPGEVALLGVDNDELPCLASDPPLSSIDPNAELLGRRAAEMLVQCIEGESAPGREPLKIPPRRIVPRGSTDVLAIEDAQVYAGIEFMRSYFREPISVADALRRISLSRRAFEVRFRKAVGRTPGAELRRLRLQRARQLLTETNFPMEKVAAECGFANVTRLDEAFRRTVGTTPSRYRRSQR